MKKGLLLIFILLQIGCKDRARYNIELYHKMTNQAELSVCNGNYGEASSNYEKAFRSIQKPFGNDVFNAVLVNQLIQKTELRDEYLKLLINNLEDLNGIQEILVGQYISKESFNKLVKGRETDYDVKLRDEFREIEKRDQLFRPMYDTHDDTITANRIININRVLQLTDSIGYPSHIELGYDESLFGQKHDIALIHTAQRRSNDKSVLDLAPLLSKGVKDGRLDPENAIFFISMQNDKEKEAFEVYETWQLQHYLLPDSLNSKIWMRDLDASSIIRANNIRRSWNADSLEDILLKTDFLVKNKLPFIFTSVRTSVSHMPDYYDLEKALDQYRLGTSGMKLYKRIKDGD